MFYHASLAPVGKLCKSQLRLQDFKLKFTVELFSILFFGNLRFIEPSVLNTDPETLFKYKNCWSKCLHEIILVHSTHFFNCVYQHLLYLL